MKNKISDKISVCFSNLKLLSEKNDVEGLRQYVLNNRKLLQKEDWKLISSIFSLDEDFIEENFEYLSLSIILTKNKVSKKILYLIAQERPHLINIIFLTQDLDKDFFLLYQDKVSKEIINIYNLRAMQK